LALQRLVARELLGVYVAAVDLRRVPRIGDRAATGIDRAPHPDRAAAPVERALLELQSRAPASARLRRDRDDAGRAVRSVEDGLRSSKHLHPLDRRRIDLSEKVAHAAGARLVDLDAVDDDQDRARRKPAHLRIIELARAARLLELEPRGLAQDLGKVGEGLLLDLDLVDHGDGLSQLR